MGNAWKPAYNDEETNFLSPQGVKQAELAGYLIGKHTDEIDVIMCSHAVRARQTAVTAMQTFGDWKRAYHRDDRLNEWCFGAPDTTHWANYETQEDFYYRVACVYNDEIKNFDPNKTQVVVSHFYTMSALFECIRRDHAGESLDPMGRELPWPKLDHEARPTIPNAVPYLYDGSTDVPQMMDHHGKVVAR